MAVVVVAACHTPYQAEGVRGGYSETQIAADTWAVHARVNGFTDRGTAMEYAYRRAGELCPGGFDVQDAETSTDVSYHPNGYNNGVNRVEKPEVTLIARCRAQAVAPAPVAVQGPPGGAPRPETTADGRLVIYGENTYWWCYAGGPTNSDGRCLETEFACKEDRAKGVANGLAWGECHSQWAVACFFGKAPLTGQNLVSCFPSIGACDGFIPMATRGGDFVSTTLDPARCDIYRAHR